MVTVPGPELVVLRQRQVFCPLLTSHVTSQSLDLSDRCPCAVRGTPQASSTFIATTSSPSASSSTPTWCSTQSKGSPAWSRLRSARSTVTNFSSNICQLNEKLPPLRLLSVDVAQLNALEPGQQLRGGGERDCCLASLTKDGKPKRNRGKRSIKF